MNYVSGQIYRGERFEEGYLGFEDGIIKEIGKGTKKDSVAKGIIVPTFVNTHTHIGDAVIQEEIRGGIEEIVAPPNGLKHRILGNTPPEIIMETMRAVTKKMFTSGIEYFSDFREGGIEGVDLLNKALQDSPLSYRIFGRPAAMKYDNHEMEELLKSVDGIGLSAISDWSHDEIKRISEHAKREKKSFALHASERIREDMDAILDLQPDFLIHMTEAEESDLEICVENELPIIVCPRSEVFFGHVPDIPKMLEKGVTLALGTDNAMLNKPYSLLREMEFAYKISKLKGSVDAEEILKMVLQNPRKVLNLGDDICLSLEKKANFVVFDLPTKDPAHALVNGACSGNISMISINNHIWMNSNRRQ
jgi:cytosine/adenosine deaminase-related metal-dependent hydrolase